MRIAKRFTMVSLVLGVVAALGLALSGGGRLWAEKSAEMSALFAEVELLAEAITVVRSDYVEVVTPKALIYGALKGMIGGLDRHSQFMEPEAYSEMKVDTKGEFGGVGLEISLSDEGVLMVVAPLDDTPSSRAGLKPNDRIVKIDGESTRGFGLSDAVKVLRGRAGSKVVLTVLRESENKVFDVTLTRAIIQIQSVKEAQMLSDHIGYIRISEFQDNTPRDLNKALKRLRQEKMKALILDLRNNPGGLLDVAVEVSQVFLPKDVLVVYTLGRVKEQNLEFKSRDGNPYLDFPIMILVNGGSASASEIVAGALRDHKRAVLVGEKTFGKGSVQTVIPLSDGSAIRLTTSKYYTPLGRVIHNNGLDPDVEVRPEKSEDVSPRTEPLLPAEDPVVLKAMELIRTPKLIPDDVQTQIQEK